MPETLAEPGEMERLLGGVLEDSEDSDTSDTASPVASSFRPSSDIEEEEDQHQEPTLVASSPAATDTDTPAPAPARAKKRKLSSLLEGLNLQETLARSQEVLARSSAQLLRPEERKMKRLRAATEVLKDETELSTAQKIEMLSEYAGQGKFRKTFRAVVEAGDEDMP